MSDQRIGTRTVCLTPDTLPYGRRGPPHRPAVIMVRPGRDGSRRGRAGGLGGLPRGRRLTVTGTRPSAEGEIRGNPPDRNRARCLPALDLRQRRGHRLQPVPDRRRGTTALPRRAAGPAPADLRSGGAVLPVERLRWITFG